MYPLAIATATALDVIRRSATCHPTLFVEALHAQQSMHLKYSTECLNAAASKAARGMALDCANAIEFVESEDFAGFDATAPRVVAFGVAARLQCIPRGFWDSIVTREG